MAKDQSFKVDTPVDYHSFSPPPLSGSIYLFPSSSPSISLLFHFLLSSPSCSCSHTRALACLTTRLQLYRVSPRTSTSSYPAAGPHRRRPTVAPQRLQPVHLPFYFLDPGTANYLPYSSLPSPCHSCSSQP
jgi:hypothetical protein